MVSNADILGINARLLSVYAYLFSLLAVSLYQGIFWCPEAQVAHWRCGKAHTQKGIHTNGIVASFILGIVQSHGWCGQDRCCRVSGCQYSTLAKRQTTHGQDE
jgi:hypothetical protein